MKICTKCRKEKPLSEFNRDKRTKGGYMPQCRVCVEKRRLMNVARKHVPVDRYGLTPTQIESLSENNQWTLKAIKSGYFEYLFVAPPYGEKAKRSYNQDDREAFRKCMTAINKLKSRKPYKKRKVA